MSELIFPEGFFWGAATSAHQVEGGNDRSDWWAWELAENTRCKEPSGSACEQYTRYPQDIALMAGLGLNTYRFSVEWARIEPEPGVVDEAALQHYVDVTQCLLDHGMRPFVTLNHFTLPLWVAQDGGWASPQTPVSFERYCRWVLEALGDRVDWFNPINEAGSVAMGGYLGGWGFPPNVVDYRQFRSAVAGLVEGHHRAVTAVRDVRPGAKVGTGLLTSETRAIGGGVVAGEAMNEAMEEPFIEAAADDDFIGIQTYTRFTFTGTEEQGEALRRALASGSVQDALPLIWAMTDNAEGTQAPAGTRTTDMGWEYAPEAGAETARRIAARYPDKDLFITEHGLATKDDAERVEFIQRGLTALHAAIEDGVRLRGYLHWSLLDNFEWAQGYGMRFGLIAVDRTTQERTIKPSARLLGEIARTGRLTLPD